MDVRSKESCKRVSFIYLFETRFESVVCLSEDAPIYRYSPPFWAAIHKWYPHKNPILWLNSLYEHSSYSIISRVLLIPISGE